MPTSSSTVFFAYLFFTHFCLSMLYLRVRYLRYTQTQHNIITTADHGSPGPPAHVLVPHHQNSPGQFWQSPLHRNPQSDVHTFLPVSRLVRVAIFFLLEDQETRCCHELTKRQGHKTRGRKYSLESRNAAAGISAATTLRCFICFGPLFCCPGRECS